MLRSVVSCKFEHRPGSNDHASASNIRNQGQRMNLHKKVPVWDFALYLDDGTIKRLHPEWNKNKFICFQGTNLPDVDLPNTGAGGSDGPGSFTRQLNQGMDCTLHFHTPQSRASAHSRMPCPPDALPVTQAMPQPPPPPPPSQTAIVVLAANPQAGNGLIVKAPPPHLVLVSDAIVEKLSSITEVSE